MENQAAAKTAPSQSLQDFQTTTQFFFESANYCFGQCVRDFSVKDLNKSLKACFAAVLKAASLESTAWCLPKWTSTQTSCTGYPAITPLAIRSAKPFPIAGMKFPGITPPTIESIHKKLALSS